MMLAVLLVAAGSFQCTSEQARRAEQVAREREMWETQPIRPGYCKVRELFWRDLIDSAISLRIVGGGLSMPLSWVRVYLSYPNHPNSDAVDARSAFSFALTYDADTIRTLDDTTQFCSCDSTLSRVFREHRVRCIDRFMKRRSFDSVYAPWLKRRIARPESQQAMLRVIFSDTTLAPAVAALKRVAGVREVFRIVEMDIMPTAIEESP